MRVTTTRLLADGTIRRFRKCEACGRLLTTEEWPVSDEREPPAQASAA
jgi:transcriptional regulator NrdR family protein